jgi:hypothetical protein
VCLRVAALSPRCDPRNDRLRIEVHRERALGEALVQRESCGPASALRFQAPVRSPKIS